MVNNHANKSAECSLRASVSDNEGKESTCLMKCRKCPGCETDLAKLLRQQGSGGWISIRDHLKKCRLTSRLSSEQVEQLVALETLAQEQCDYIAQRKLEARQKNKLEREKKKAKAQVPYFAALSREAPKPQVFHKSCSNCSAEFTAKDEKTLCRIFEEHSTACADRLRRQREHHQRVCEASVSKREHAQKRVNTLESLRDKAKEALKQKERAIEEQKRLKRVQQGKKNKNRKRNPYQDPPPLAESDEAEQQSTIQGCMHRLREAEKELRAGRERLRVRVESEEIATEASNGIEHKAVRRRAEKKQVQRQERKQVAFTKKMKRMSKEDRVSEKTEKSRKKGERSKGADKKWMRASYE